MKDYDLLILSAPKDFTKINFVVDSCNRYLNPAPSSIFLIAPESAPDIPCDVQTYLDHEVLPLDRNKTSRSNWVFQQFVKLFQDVTNLDQYLVVDADLFYTRQLDLYEEDGRTRIFLGRDQYRQYYFNYMQKMFGLERVFQHSFINEFMMFDKAITRELLKNYDDSVEKLYDISCRVMKFNPSDPVDEYWISEYELYGNYVIKNYPAHFSVVKVNIPMHGKQGEFSADEITRVLTYYQNKDVDGFTLHTWLE